MQSGAGAARLGRWLPPVVMLAGLAALTLVYLVLRADAFDALVTESGPVEVVTALLYIALTGVLLTPRSRAAFGLVPFLLAAVLLGREADHYLRFNGRSIFSARLYSDPAAPLALKVVLLAALAALVVIVTVSLIRNAPRLLAAMRRRSAFVFPLVWAAFLIALSLALDRVSRHVQALFAITLPDATQQYLHGVEETAELLIPVMLLLAVWQGLADDSRRLDPQGSRL